MSPREIADKRRKEYFDERTNEVRSPFKREVQDILRELDVSLSENMSEDDERHLSEEGRRQRIELSKAKGELSDYELDEEQIAQMEIEA